jgi:hypothetical protein
MFQAITAATTNNLQGTSTRGTQFYRNNAKRFKKEKFAVFARIYKAFRRAV